MSRQAYRIIKWAGKHEGNESLRKEFQSLKYIGMPIDRGSLGLKRTLKLSDGTSVFGTYVLMAELAGAQPVRGVLATSDGPMSIQDIAERLEIAVDLVSRALEVLTSESINWMDLAPWDVQIERARLQVIEFLEASGRQRSATEKTEKRRKSPAKSNETELNKDESSEAASEQAATQAVDAPKRAPLRYGNPIYNQLEARLGRQLYAYESRDICDLAQRLDDNPVTVADKAVPTEDMILAAINQLPPDVRAPLKYMATVIDAARKSHLMPGTDKGKQTAPTLLTAKGMSPRTLRSELGMADAIIDGHVYTRPEIKFSTTGIEVPGVLKLHQDDFHLITFKRSNGGAG